MNARHTPGPWDAITSDGRNYRIIGGEEAGYVAIVEAIFQPRQNAANARLIAAAPDLLEACKAASAVLTGFYNAVADSIGEWESDGSRPLYKAEKILRAAIAKAEGWEI